MSGTSSDRSSPTSQSANSSNTASRGVTETELAYIAGNNSIRTLVVLTQGLKKEDGSDLIDIKDEQPWKSIPKIEIKPTLDMLKEEVKRRHKAFGLPKPEPRPAAWRSSKISKWLDDHPIDKEPDLDFLRKTISTCRQSSQRAQAYRQFERDAASSNWIGKYPYLRLIHCIVDDSIKESFIKRNDIQPGRMEVENRNSSNREKTVWEQIADLWNNPSFAPVTEGGLTELHFDFIPSISIPHEKISSMNPATPQFVQNKITGMVTSLTRIISNWERSGQGDGGFHDDGALDSDHPLFGTFANRDAAALNSRCSFCEDHQTYLLYFWHILEQHQLLQTSLNALPCGVATTDGGESVPTVITLAGRTNQTSHSKGNVESALQDIALTLGNFVKESSMRRQDEIRLKKEELQYAEKRRLEDQLEAISMEKRKTRRLLIESRQTGNDELHQFYKQDLVELDSKERRIQDKLETLES